MQISTSNRLLFQTYGWEKALEMLADAGFDCVDMSFSLMAKDPDYIYLKPEAADLCRRIRAKAEALGMYFNQSHAPFQMDMKPWLTGDRGYILELLTKAIELSGILGVKNVVVHPVQCMNYLNSDPEWIREVNVEFYGTLAPIAKKAGVTIAIENMWQRHLWNRSIVSSVCSSPYELKAYVDACNAIEPVFTACLDIGHCLLTGHDPVNAIHVLGDRLGCLHVHDVDGVEDHHTCPQTMKVDFPAVVQALRDVNYAGQFTLETDGYYTHFTEAQYPIALQNLANACALLVR